MEHSQWQSLLGMGNDCFHDKQWTQAEFFYSEAYDLLAFSYRNNPTCEETLMAWVCTCHNLSSLHESLANVDLALKFLIVPHEYLMEISVAEIDNDDVKLLAYKALNLTLPAILTFSKKHPVCNDCINKLSPTKRLLGTDSQSFH